MENFTFMWPCIVTNFFVIKPTRCTNFTNLFWNETLHISDSFSVHLQETAFEQDQDGTAVPSSSCSKAVLKPVWHIPLLSVQWINSWWRREELSKTCRVSCQNKFVKLEHIFRFIINKFNGEFHSYHKLLIQFHSFHCLVWISTHSLINICRCYIK